METEAPPVLQNLSASVESLRSDLENVQRELDQALGVWRSALVNEKKEFQTLLQSKQLAWNEQDEAWAREREAYERKIAELETHFQTQLAVTEANALKALTDLDEAWQRD